MDRFQVVPAAYIVFRQGAEVLLQLRQGTGYMDGYWALAAAGHVEADESVHAAAVREATEELGIEVAAPDLVPLCAMHRTHANGQPIDERVDFFFECRAWAGEPRIVEPEKTAALRWFALDALPAPTVPHEQSVLERIRRDDLAPIISHGITD